ncbi:hypothetical protein XmelCFBP4644_08390 [Xanthomonas melonis]|uniref:Uncharacterized protein n=1 Tax=Xanthomonas melonis TaxID=56456 RepID=A0A2S7DI94_9XANT|nr:hypothetical protein XmelCFBP4644_08390 [Xanthomonas melonis]
MATAADASCMAGRDRAHVCTRPPRQRHSSLARMLARRARWLSGPVAVRARPDGNTACIAGCAGHSNSDPRFQRSLQAPAPVQAHAAAATACTGTDACACATFTNAIG